jgi:putative ABC transport system permease protein
MNPMFWLRWSWRDFRRRTTQVLAIAVVVALGSGLYAGLGSTSVWRTDSLTLSLRRLDTHDVEIATAGGLPVGAGALATAGRRAGGSALGTVQTRLIANLPVRAGADGAVPAAGEIVGVDLAAAPRVDAWKVVAGHDLPSSGGKDEVLLDAHFASAHHLPATGRITIAGTAVTYAGTVLEPEHLTIISTVGATIQGAATHAVIYAPLALAQRLAGMPGQVNDAVALATPGTSLDSLATAMTGAMPAALPNAPVLVTPRTQDTRITSLFDEIRSEQQIFDVFAVLILAGAGFSAFTLTRRIVEAQRRDIGIGMALGVKPQQIAIRTLALALEIAVVGVALGVLAGWGIGAMVLAVAKANTPFPFWTTPWQSGLFLRAAALGLVIPLAGSAYPVWRAVRVVPTDALLPPHLRGRRRLLASALRRLRLPGSMLSQAPVRRIAIAPARSVMTVCAIMLVLAPLLAALGASDSTSATLGSGDTLRAGPATDTLLVDLTSYQSATSPTVQAVTGDSAVAASSLGLDTGGYLIGRGRTIGISISMVDLSNPLAAPRAVVARRIQPGGIVISAKAAADLGVREGGQVVLRHPESSGARIQFVDSRLPVRAVIDSPFRFVAYMDLRDEPLMGMSGIVNAATVQPRAGVSPDDLQRRLASHPGVASALSVASLSSTMRDMLSVVSRLFVILQVVIAALAFLIAFNSSRTGADERVRENATEMAFGVPVYRVVATGVAESVLLGAAGAAAGVALGLVVQEWLMRTVFPAAVPDLAVLSSTSARSVLVTVAIGLLATAGAPLLTTRRLRRTNLPGTLRYVE